MTVLYRRSLFSRFLRDTVLGLALVLSCAFVAMLVGITVKERSDQQASREDLAQILARGLSAGMWHYDVRAIDDTILAYELSGQLEYALIEDQYGTALTDRLREMNRAADVLVPMPSELGGIQGHLKIWWPQTTPWLSVQNRYILVASLVVLVLVAITSSLLVRGALRRHILVPLEVMRNALLTGNSDLSMERHAGLYASHEFNSFRQAFEKMQNSLEKERARSREAYRGQEQALERKQESHTALMALFEVVGQTMIIVDDRGQLIACHVSRPFFKRHIGQLQAIAEDPEQMSNIMSEFGFHGLTSLPNSDPRRSLMEFRAGGCLYHASTLRLSMGKAMIVSDVTSETNMQAAMDEILDATETGIALFSEVGELRSVRGASLDRLFGATQSRDKLPAAMQNLLEQKEGTQAVQVDDKHYQLQAVTLRSGLICVSHTDVSAARHAERELQNDRSLRMMGQLTSGIAHDFNNILGVIIGNLELMQLEGHRGSEDVLSQALKAAKNGSSTVRHLLAYARNKTLSSEDTDLDCFLEENIKLLRNAAGDGIDVLLNCDARSICTLDQSMFVSALLNLVVNARDAMDGQGQIEIKTSVSVDSSRPGCYVSRVEVQDTGPGVPADLARTIFEPYFTTKPQQLGTGLGLSMVKGFLESSGGRIEQRNTKKGALFVLELPSPRLRLDTVRPLKTAKRPPRSVKVEPGDSRTNLLLVDDEAALLRVAKLHLSATGYSVHAFDDPLKALEWVRTGAQVDLVVVDYAMPGLNGLELVEEVSKLGMSSPFLLCSGNISDETCAHARHLGVSSIIEKPYSLHDLCAEVQKALASEVKPRKLEKPLEVLAKSAV